MKKIVLMLALMLATFTVKANNILYFTYNQAARTVAYLNNQDELMIYCGYENELPTYVLVNEVWAEQISSSFFEVWLFGFDAYTGEEIFMPIDLECIYLMQGGKIFSAAQYLRFRTSHARPTFVWAMPPYNPFIRAPRPLTFYYTYHYDIHRPGWHYRHYPHIHYHPYYMRPPHRRPPYRPSPTLPARSTLATTPLRTDTNTTTCPLWDASPHRARPPQCRTTPPDVAEAASPATAKATPLHPPTV